MKTYYVEVKVEMPYPQTFTAQPKASSAATAISRALREIRSKHLARRKIGEIRVFCKPLMTLQDDTLNDKKK